MKQYFPITVIFITVCAALAACEKNTYKITERTNPQGKGRVKIGLFSAYTLTPPVRVSINNVTVSNELVHPISFPGGGLNMNGSSNSDYLQLNPGTAKFEFFVMNPGTHVPASKMFETTQTVEPDKRYTLYVTDTAQNTTAILVNDETTAPDSGMARIKWVNILPNIPVLDLYKGTNASSAVLILANIAYKSSSAYMNVPAGVDSFFIRQAGSPATSVPVARRGFSLSNQRLYTILSRGYSGGTGNRAANVSAIINQ
ncbi:MAG: DUF4397 domain-containing protein [Chitinophagaceae bacterium]